MPSAVFCKVETRRPHLPIVEIPKSNQTLASPFHRRNSRLNRRRFNHPPPIIGIASLSLSPLYLTLATRHNPIHRPPLPSHLRPRRRHCTVPAGPTHFRDNNSATQFRAFKEIMNREWMYRRFTNDGYISPEFHQGLESFIQFACSQPAYMDGDKIRCPCRKCKNLAYRDVDTVRLHICSKGFVFNYHVWSVQGEGRIRSERPNPGTGFGKHRRGFRSVVANSYQMGVPIKKLHYSEHEDNYTIGKEKCIDDEVEAQVADLSQSLPKGVSPMPADTSDIFIGVAQHPVKNRVFGIGSLNNVPSVCSKWEGGGSGMTSTQSDEVQTQFEASEKVREELEHQQDDYAEDSRGAAAFEGDV